MKERALLFSLALVFPSLQAQETYPPMHRLTWQEYEGTLVHWRKTFPQFASLESRGRSGQSMPVYLLTITDKSVPDTDKQICLVTTLHSGPERTGTTGAMAFAEWLLGDDPLAVETRQKQIVLIMPVVNPLAMFHTDRFRNEKGIDPYTGLGPLGKIWDIKSLSLNRPQDAPELVAVLSVIDDFRPEVHADLHGTGLQEYLPEQLGSRQMYHGQIMTEITGGAYSNYALRPWDWRVIEAMAAAGREAGFPSDRFEADAQRTFWGPELAPLGKKLWHGSPLFYSAHYGYAKYHTMVITQEVAWEQSLVARMKGLLRIGNGVWLEENRAGYPVDRMKHFVGHYVTSTGNHAAERRASRTELWSKQAAFSAGFLYPQTVGRESFVVATTAAAKKAVAVNDLPALKQNLRRLLGGAAEDIARFLDAGPEIKLAMESPPQILQEAKVEDDVLIERGIGFRLRLPYANVGDLDVRLNGRALVKDAPDGYQTWTAEGWTQIQVHVPPGSSEATGLYFITCDYQPGETRPTGWMPPTAVREQCATDQADATPATFTDVPYGSHFRQTMDVWLSESDPPRPVVFYLHGGGWAAQDKTDIHQHLDVRGLLDAGLSVASINYRFLIDAGAANVTPPLQWPLQDAARALQFLRSKASGWNLDKRRVAACGVSAGGCASLWLAMHADMAEPAGDDPVAKESTRVLFSATMAPQTSLDPGQLMEWIPNSEYGGHAFGYPGATRPEAFAPFLAHRDDHLADFQRYSPLSQASADDPPAFLFYPRQDKPPVKGEPQTDPTHSAVLGLMLQERLESLGVSCVVRYPGDGLPGESSLQQTLIQSLTSAKP